MYGYATIVQELIISTLTTAPSLAMEMTAAMDTVYSNTVNINVINSKTKNSQNS